MGDLLTWVKLAAGCAVAMLGACATSEDEVRAEIRREAVRTAEPVIDFELRVQPVPEHRPALEAQTMKVVTAKCAEPIFGAYLQQIESMLAEIELLPDMSYLKLMPIAAKTDADLRQCFHAHGAIGSVFMQVGADRLPLTRFLSEAYNLSSSGKRAGPSIRGGCGSRGGPGWRTASGRCASWRD